MHKMGDAPPSGFVPSAPLAPPSYDEAVRQAGPPYATQPTVSYQETKRTYPAPQPYVVQQPIMRPAPTGFPHAAAQGAPMATVVVNVGPMSARMECPHCHQLVSTRVETEIQKAAHIACLILCLLGCFLCSCLPYCLSSFKDVHHHCPKCKGFIGTYKH